MDNLTNNTDLNNLIGNFIKVVNTNLEKSINQQDNEYDINISSEKDEDFDKSSDNLTENEKLNLINQTDTISIIKSLLVDKNGNSIANILSEISKNLETIVQSIDLDTIAIN